MILPIWGQECLVTLPGSPQRILGEARAPYVDPNGRYHLMVWSRHWGYERHFPAPAIMLLPRALPGGVEYDAEAAFRAMYTQEQIDGFAAVEAGMKPIPAQVLPAAPKTPMQRARSLVKPMQFQTEQQALQSIATAAKSTTPARPQRVVRKPNG